jgi:hypothetical protein
LSTKAEKAGQLADSDMEHITTKGESLKMLEEVDLSEYRLRAFTR